MPVLEGDGDIVKITHPERVFCYELYHQLRQRTNSLIDFDLHGELSKVYHPLFTKNKKIPDFILHKAGDMKSNFIVIEVKAVLTSEIQKDFETLIGFISEQRYDNGIFILYGLDASNFITYVIKHMLIPETPIEIMERIYLVFQQRSNISSEVIKLSKLFNK